MHLLKTGLIDGMKVGKVGKMGKVDKVGKTCKTAKGGKHNLKDILEILSISVNILNTKLMVLWILFPEVSKTNG